MKKSCITGFTLSLNKKNLFTLIYSFQFGFRQNHSTTHALTQLTKNIFVNIWFCRAQCASKKANIVSLQELQVSGLRLTLEIAKSLCWFIGLTLMLLILNVGSQASILSPLQFLIYINDSHCAIKYCEVPHFADDTNLVSFQISVKTINKQVNDLKSLSKWVNANKISLNVSKIELLMFNPPKNSWNKNLK